jgi:hypothetical protein
MMASMYASWMLSSTVSASKNPVLQLETLRRICSEPTRVAEALMRVHKLSKSNL